MSDPRGPASWLFAAAAAAAFAGACAEPAPAVAPAAPPTARVAPAAPMPTPGRARGEAAVAANARCEGCHRDAAESWRASLHRRADIEPSYRRAFAIEPLPFCRSCHAPEADPLVEESATVAALGVGCVTCHVTDSDAVLAAPGPGRGPAPHPISRREAFATTAACASCHEFTFPGRAPAGPDSFMQSTVREHAASPAADRSCAACHMPPDASGRRSHAFVASRSPEIVAGAARVRAERLDATRVRVVLTPNDPGHAFPTGDLFRRVAVVAELSTEGSGETRPAARFLTRHWGFSPSAGGRELQRDDRLHSDPRVVDLELAGDASAGARAVAWRVAYQRVAHPNGVDEAGAEVEGEIVIASGVLPPLAHSDSTKAVSAARASGASSRP